MLTAICAWAWWGLAVRRCGAPGNDRPSERRQALARGTKRARLRLAAKHRSAAGANGPPPALCRWKRDWQLDAASPRQAPPPGSPRWRDDWRPGRPALAVSHRPASARRAGSSPSCPRRQLTSSRPREAGGDGVTLVGGGRCARQGAGARQKALGVFAAGRNSGNFISRAGRDIRHSGRGKARQNALDGGRAWRRARRGLLAPKAGLEPWLAGVWQSNTGHIIRHLRSRNTSSVPPMPPLPSPDRQTRQVTGNDPVESGSKWAESGRIGQDWAGLGSSGQEQTGASISVNQ